MDMDRRAFLKTLGLGAVALTVPKPLGIMTAKMEDFERPPLHVGFAETRPADGCGDRGYFMLYDIGVSVEKGIDASRLADYTENWCISLFLRKRADPSRGIKYVQVGAGHFPDPQRMVKYRDEDGRPAERPDFMTAPRAYVLTPDDVLEFWFSPHSALYDTEAPNYPLPKLKVVLRGVRVYPSEQRTGKGYVLGGRQMAYWHIADVKKVLLDRARAIELGLVAKDTPEFYDFTT
jgi:hypothetical protein